MNILEALANRVASIVTTNALLVRTFILVLFVSLLALGFMEYIRRVWRGDFELKMPGGNGAIAFRSSFDDGFRNVIFLVPASKCWINTGLEFKPGDRIRFRTSGQVHLAQNLIRQEEISEVGWSNPAGSDFVELMKGIKRSSFLISQYRNDDRPLIGNLVGFLQVDGIDDKPDSSNPRPVGKNGNKVFHIGDETKTTNETGHNACLWLTVNDLVLNDSESAKAAYVGDSLEFIKKELEYPTNSLDLDSLIRTTSAVSKWKRHRDYWDTIKQKGEWDIYFHDNIGTYLVFIERESKRGF